MNAYEAALKYSLCAPKVRIPRIFYEFWTFATIAENSWTIATFLIVEEAESDQNLTKMNPPEMGCAHFGQLCVNKMLRILPAGWPPAGC